MDTTAAKKTLIICYSLSGQTSNLLETDKWSGIHRRIGNHRKAAPGKASALSVRINPDNSDHDDADLFQKAHSPNTIVR
jgi:hypothetical protein